MRPSAPNPSATDARSHCRPLRPPRPDAKKNATSARLDCLSAYRQQLWRQTTSAALFAQPPLIDFTAPPPLPEPAAGPWRALQTTTRTVVTLAMGKFIARETLWWNPTTDQVCPAPALRRLVAPACNYGHDGVVYVGKALFLDTQPVRQIMAQLDRQPVHLSASTVTELGRRFIALLALAHRRNAARLKEAMALRGGYILHLEALMKTKAPGG